MGRQAFEGVHVADLSWIGMGPVMVKYLADHGATVVRVESAVQPDGLRMAGPFRDDVPHINGSGFFANFNNNKLGLSLTLGLPEGRAVARRLIAWADVLVESFTPRVMEGWGLGYPEVSRIKADIVMLSATLQGQTGPYRGYAGFGGQGAALTGIHYLTGWPDREPAGPYGAYADFIAPRFGAALLAAALDYRRRTGKGQYIDLAQVETGLQFLAPAVLDYTVNGRVAGRTGNRSGSDAPHGAFRCKGDDRWIAIAVESDEDWHRLKAAMGSPAWSEGPRFATREGRLAGQDDLEQQVEAWTAPQDAHAVMERLQAFGVAAGVVQKTSDLFDDPQLAHRRHFQMLEHAHMGVCAYESPAFRLSGTPAELQTAAPVLGQDTRFVLSDILGYDDAEIEDLAAAGALT